jgi:uncharacterized membrane protein YkoI
MKKLLFLTASLFFSIITFAQEIRADEVPSVVLNAFKQKFPKASDVEWERKDQLYKVEFEIGRTDHEAWINNTGGIVKHKRDIRTADLPREVTASINRSYKGYRIDDVERIEEGQKFLYKVELKTLSKEEEVIFDPKGEIVKVN